MTEPIPSSSPSAPIPSSSRPTSFVLSCSSRTRRPSRYGCWPMVLPTGPEKLPDWIPDTRSGGVWSSAHHGPWSGGMLRCRQESRMSYVAAVAARELHAGR